MTDEKIFAKLREIANQNTLEPPKEEKLDELDFGGMSDDEIREKMGIQPKREPVRDLKSMSPEEHEQNEEIRAEFEHTLRAAVEEGDASSDLAREAVRLHGDWLSAYADYSIDAHMKLIQMYGEDERGLAYYEEIAPGAAGFLAAAARNYYGV